MFQFGSAFVRLLNFMYVLVSVSAHMPQCIHKGQRTALELVLTVQLSAGSGGQTRMAWFAQQVPFHSDPSQQPLLLGF